LLSDKDRERYRSMPDDELRDIEDKHDVPIESSFGVRFSLSAPLRTFVALDWDHANSKRTSLETIDPVSRPDLIDNIMKSAGVMLPQASARRPKPKQVDYVDLLQDCEFVALQGQVDFDRGADLILAKLNA
ncbi:MAG: hypothetical protein AAF525_09710, partial [Pseudomonadota bacterium]